MLLHDAVLQVNMVDSKQKYPKSLYTKLHQLAANVRVVSIYSSNSWISIFPKMANIHFNVIYWEYGSRRKPDV